MSFEIKNFDNESLKPKVGNRSKAYPFAKLEVNQYFDIEQVNGSPKLVSVKQLCHFNSRNYGMKFKYAYINQADENGNRTIRVWADHRIANDTLTESEIHLQDLLQNSPDESFIIPVEAGFTHAKLLPFIGTYTKNNPERRWGFTPLEGGAFKVYRK